MKRIIKKSGSRKTFLKYNNLLIATIFVVTNFYTSYSQVEVPLSKRTELTLKGDFKFVSNTILGKVSNDDGTGVFDPNQSYNDGGLNNQFRMGFIDIDDDPSTFNSSSAKLNTNSNCNAIKHVGLYWTAAYADENRAHDISSIKLKLPGASSYTDINNATVIHDYYTDKESIFKQYSCYKDITELVLGLSNPNGMYTVANIPATTSEVNDDDKLGNGLAGGWTIVVIYEDASKPRKRFYVYDGFVNIDAKAKPVKFSFDNFQTIPKGSVNAKIGVISYEGDKGIRGDRFQVLSRLSGKYKSITDNTNPMNNFFNANITENGRDITTRIPASRNTLGYDADLFNIKNAANNIIGNNQSEASFRLLTDNDGYSVSAVAFSIEIYEPAIHMVKRSKYKDGKFIFPTDYLAPDEEITYSITVYNDGNDDSKNTVITDRLPEHVIFSKESVVLPSKKIKYKYDKEAHAIRFTIPDKLVKKNSPSFKINYNVLVTTSCESINEHGEALIVDNPVIAEFNGTLNESKKYTEGYNHYNKCNAPDFYRMKLAVDLTGLNCPNFIKYARVPKKQFEDKNKELADVDYDKKSQTAGFNEKNNEDQNSPTAAAEKPNTIRDLIDLNEIYFEFDKWDITTRAADELNKIVSLMTKEYPDMVIKIETHSDSRGNDDYNMSLSQKRAESIYNYLVSQEISENRILSYQGFGETRPINNCLDGANCDEEEYRKNRRSNFVIQ